MWSEAVTDIMKEEFKQTMQQLWQNHRGKTVGLTVGLILGIAILCFGFWHTVFVLCCGLIGLWIGVQLDRGEDIFVAVGRKLDHLLQRSRW